VALPDDSPRGGVLGMAGVAMRGSDGNRTKPVHRGVYVREVFFNDPPDPPTPHRRWSTARYRRAPPRRPRRNSSGCDGPGSNR